MLLGTVTNPPGGQCRALAGLPLITDGKFITIKNNQPIYSNKPRGVTLEHRSIGDVYSSMSPNDHGAVTIIVTGIYFAVYSEAIINLRPGASPVNAINEIRTSNGYILEELVMEQGIVHEVMEHFEIEEGTDSYESLYDYFMMITRNICKMVSPGMPYFEGKLHDVFKYINDHGMGFSAYVVDRNSISVLPL